MSGILPKQCLWGATTFVYHVIHFVYVHLMQDLSLAETLFAKEVMEKVMAQALQSAKHYHADNGSFEEIDFLTPSIVKVRN